MTTPIEQNILKEIEDRNNELKLLIHYEAKVPFTQSKQIGLIQHINMLRSKLEGYQLAQKETAEKVNKLKEKIENAQEEFANLDWIDKNNAIVIINKIFKETK